MTIRKLVAITGVACTYVGTVVGAGFASGQEIYQFFGKSGAFSWIGVVVAALLFIFIGEKLMVLGAQLRADSFRKVNAHLFGKRVGTAVDISLWVMLFGTSVAMIAGAGELFLERNHIPFQLGAIFTVLMTYFTVSRGMRGVVRANSVIVPLMFGSVLFAVMHSLSMHVHEAVVQPPFGSPIRAAMSGLLYAALNAGLSVGVLVPLGAKIQNRSVLKLGAIAGSMALTAMVVLILLAFTKHPEALGYALPMGYIAGQSGSWFGLVFTLALWGEIYSTMAGNVYALVTALPKRFLRSQKMALGGVLIIAFLFSHVGFANIVEYGYVAFGWVSLCILLAVLWPRPDQPST